MANNVRLEYNYNNYYQGLLQIYFLKLCMMSYRSFLNNCQRKHYRLNTSVEHRTSDDMRNKILFFLIRDEDIAVFMGV